MHEKYLPHYTTSDYQRWEGDWELIEGIPHAMNPSPARKHQRLSTLLLRQIGNSFEKKGKHCKDCIELHELDWIINDDTVLRPDIAIVCNLSGDFITSPPVLIIEIISPATALKDRHVKFEIYQSQGVKYYILVDPTSKSHNVFSLENGQYHDHGNLSTFNIHDHCAIDLDIKPALAELE